MRGVCTIIPKINSTSTINTQSATGGEALQSQFFRVLDSRNLSEQNVVSVPISIENSNSSNIFGNNQVQILNSSRIQPQSFP